MRKGEMYMCFLCETPKERNDWEDVYVDWRIKLE
jgi:hypothetical protein